MAEAVRRAKAEVAAALADDPSVSFDAFATTQLAAAGFTADQVMAAMSPAGNGADGSEVSPSPNGNNNVIGVPTHLQMLASAVTTANATARDARVKVFRVALRRIDALNARSGDDLAYGLTPFTHLKPSEFRRMYLSKPFSQLARAGDPRRRSLLQGGGLTCNAEVSFPYGGVTPPSAKDWRSVDGVSYVPSSIRNQGSCGSCAAFAASALLETSIIRQYRLAGYTSATTDVSEQEELDCLPGDGCQGSLPHLYLDRAMCRGVAFERAYGYRGSDSGVCPSTGQLGRFASGSRAWAEPPANERGVAQALTQGGPVAIAVYANDAFMNYRAGTFDCRAAGGTSSLNHAIVAVGFNDQARTSSGSTVPSWSARNSWGTGWGMSGFLQLRKNCAGSGTLNMYTRGYNAVLVA